jgi:hypothetical protein
MNKNMESEKILAAAVLPNGITVTFYDLSRKVAADRWLVKVKCEADFEAGEQLFASLNDAKLAVALQEDGANRMRHQLFRERNFIDAREKDAVLHDLFTKLHENAISYMGSELFLRRLFEKKVEAFKLENRIQEEIRRQTALAEDDDDGPADFSACFKD